MYLFLWQGLHSDPRWPRTYCVTHGNLLASSRQGLTSGAPPLCAATYTLQSVPRSQAKRLQQTARVCYAARGQPQTAHKLTNITESPLLQPSRSVVTVPSVTAATITDHQHREDETNRAGTTGQTYIPAHTPAPLSLLRGKFLMKNPK